MIISRTKKEKCEGNYNVVHLSGDLQAPGFIKINCVKEGLDCAFIGAETPIMMADSM